MPKEKSFGKVKKSKADTPSAVWDIIRTDSFSKTLGVQVMEKTEK